MPDEKGIYLYCFAENVLETSLADFSNDAYLLDLAGIKALVTDVRLDDFTGEKGEENLQNLEWLMPKVVLHERITESILQNSAVFPVAFGSIFSSPESLQATVEKNKETIIEFLNFTKNADEIGLKGFLERETAKQKILLSDFAAEFAELDNFSAGRKFFAEKKLIEKAENSVNQRLDEICNQAAQKLSASAKSSTQRKVVQSDDEGEQVINWAFLIQRDKIAEFNRLIEEINTEVSAFGFKLRVSNVLPPYSFVPQLI
jgi:Gas vesicle synthesis protein GvpL/GvpF